MLKHFLWVRKSNPKQLLIAVIECEQDEDYNNPERIREVTSEVQEKFPDAEVEHFAVAEEIEI